MELTRRLIVLILLVSSISFGRVRAFGWCERGGQTITLAGMTSSATTPVQRSYPACTVTVTINGGGAATIYADNAGTPKANPFTSSSTGYWFFYADNGRYDVQFSGTGITSPFTLGDIPLFDSSGSVGITSLNALTGATQTFTNDTNVTITSGGTAHVLGWSGTLAVSRGGSGAGTFTTNGVLLGNGTSAFAATGAGSANQVFRIPGAGGAPAFGAIDLSLAAAVTGTLGIANGGLGITSGTSGGVLYFSGASTLASSGALTANRIVLGGGAGVAPTILGSLGTTTTLLHGNAAGAPTFSAVSLTADVSGILPVANGGTGLASGTSGGILGYTGTGTLASSALLTNHAILLGAGAGAVPTALGSLGTTTTVLHGNAAGVPSFGAVSLTADVTGILPVANGGSPVTCTKYTVAYTNPAFIANSATADVTLFTNSQYRKITGVTVKHSVIFSDGGGSITDVSVSAGKAGSTTFYTAATSIGEATPVADTTYQDTSLFKSSTMAVAGEAVLARFTATAGVFGTGAATNLISGSVDLWVCSVLLQ